MPRIGVAELRPLAKLARGKLGVEVHQRLTVRTVILEDMETGARFPLEASRLNFYHAKAMIELLMLGEGHHEVAEGEPEEAST